MPYGSKTNYKCFKKLFGMAPDRNFCPGAPIYLSIPSKSKVRKSKNLDFAEKKFFDFEIVAGIRDRKCCRNFWQHDGDPPTKKSPETRFYEIL